MNRLMEKLTESAREMGFTAAVISSDQMVFAPEYRKYCEENLCGNYNKNYACPPYCGSPQEMKERTGHYCYALVLQSKEIVENAMDNTVVGPMKKAHNQKTMGLLKTYKDELKKEGFLAIMAGPCSLCSKCKMQENLPCPMQMDRYSCLSAYCIDVVKLAQAADMEISWELNQASFFSIILFNQPTGKQR